MKQVIILLLLANLNYLNEVNAIRLKTLKDDDNFVPAEL